MEQRKYTRLRLAIEVIAELHTSDGSCLYGETVDISLDGAFVGLNPPAEINPGDTCNLVLIIKNLERWVRVEFTATIANIRDDGIGIRFESANAQHHEAFLKLLIKGAEDLDRLLSELSLDPGKNFTFSK